MVRGTERARVCLVTGDSSVLPAFSAAVRERAQRMLRRARVTVLYQRCHRDQRGASAAGQRRAPGLRCAAAGAADGRA